MARNLAALVVKWNMTRADPKGKTHGVVRALFFHLWFLGAFGEWGENWHPRHATKIVTMTMGPQTIQSFACRWPYMECGYACGCCWFAMICPPLFYPRRFWKIVCFEYVQGCIYDAILPYCHTSCFPRKGMAPTSFTLFGIVWNLKMCWKCQNGIRKGGTARPGFWFLMGNGSPLPFMAHLPP